MNDEHEEELASVERKWEFRYENQDKRIKTLEATIKEKNRRIKELNGIILKFKEQSPVEGKAYLERIVASGDPYRNYEF